MRARLLATLILLSAVPTFASIRGTVMNRSGQPIAGAKVSAFALETGAARRARLVSSTPERVALASTTTNSGGAFILDSPKDPVVDVQVDASGFAPQVIRVVRDEDSAVVALFAAAQKQGTVTAGGKPVAGARVIWWNRATEAVSTTDSAGHYSVADPSWAVRVDVVHPDFALFDESITPPQKPNVNLTLDAGAPLAGHVVNGTAGVGKAAVFVDGFPMATTADDGSFVIAHAPRKWQLVQAQAGVLAASLPHAKTAPTLKLASPATISGTVLDAKTHQPVPSAELAFLEPMGRRLQLTAASVITDAKGNFSTPIAPGNYQIVGVHPAYAMTGMRVAIGPGQHVSKAIAAAPLAQLSGNVVDDGKRPVAAANISIAPPRRRGGFGAMMMRGRAGAGVNAMSGPDGRFVLRTPMMGEVELTATRKGLPDASSSAFHIAAGEKKSGLTITVPRGIALSGRVISHDGKPISGVAVTTTEDAGGGRPGAIMRRVIINLAATMQSDPVTTGSDGTFSIRVRPGSYDVHFSHEGYASKLVKVDEVSASTKPLQVTLDPGVEISGRVTRGGNGVEGIDIAAFDLDAQSATATGPDGSFVLPDLAPGSYMVNLSKPDDFIQQRRTINAPAQNVSIDLPAGGNITGRVVDKSSHEPVTAFQAGISNSRSGGGRMIMMPPALKNFTADDGSFTLENVPSGPTQLVVSAAGYTTAHVPNLVVEEGKTLSDIEVDLDTGVRLVGHVTGPDGAPVSGVAVRPAGAGAIRMPGMFGDSVATTDANGDYVLDSLESGDNKTFSFMLTGLLPADRTVNLSGRETRLDVQLSGGLTVTGQVVSDAGVPVPDADVRATSAAAGATPKASQTDAGGMFTFDAMAPGHYTFSAFKQGFTNGQLADFDITGGAPPRVVLESGGTLFGHVSGVADADLSKVTVTARSSSGSSEATVDAAGNYRMDGAPTGTLRVSAMLMRSFDDVRSTNVQSVDLAAGGSAQLDLQFATDTTITGHISRNGVPASNSTINFSPRGGSIQTRAAGPTDDNGNYSVGGLSDGDYTVTVVDMQSLNAYTTTYSVHGSGNFDIDIKSSALRGHVVDRGDSSPISGATVQVRRTDTHSAMSNIVTTSDDNGAFLIDGVTGGSYTVSANKDGYGNVVKGVSFTDSAPQDLTLDLARNDGITLRVVDGRDGTTLNPNLAVYDSQNRPVYSTPRFGFGGGSDSERIPVAAGQYRAVIAANGYAPKTVTLMSPSSQTVSLTPGGSLVLHSKSATARRAVLVDAGGTPYTRPYATAPSFIIPIGDTRLPNVAPGQYTLQIFAPDGSVATTLTVVVVEGHETALDVG